MIKNVVENTCKMIWKTYGSSFYAEKKHYT